MKDNIRYLSPLLAGLALTGNIMAEKRPNIVLFLVDDMGWQETSVPFWNEETALNRRYRTPNMERLAEMGVKFTQAYACAISSPSRCSLMSGMNAARHRVTNWTMYYDQTTDSDGGLLELPQWNVNGIQPDRNITEHDRHRATPITSLPQILHDNGYYTIHCGKAHFGAVGTAGEEPLNFGFDVNIGGGANGCPASYLAQDNYGTGAYHIRGLEEYYSKGTFLTEALTQEAIKALRKPIAEGQPFYLYMSHYAIHTPYNPDSRFTVNYMDSDGRGIFDEQLQANLNKEEINHAALIEGMDKSLGDLIDFIQAQPEVAANTIVIFMSDNGGQGIHVRQGRENYDQNFPARAGKGSSYEGGIHEPMIVYWPNVTQGGTINTNRVMIEDFFPTILDMADVSRYNTVQKVDGISFADLLKNTRKHRERTIVWHYPNAWTEGVSREEGYGAYSALMMGDYHLIYFWDTQELRLYNVRKDIGERNNLVSSMPRKVRKMAKRLTKELKEKDAQRPILKATGKPAPWPDEL